MTLRFPSKQADFIRRTKAAAEVLFYVGLGILFTHELDAVFNHEWRVMPLVNSLSEEQGRTVFIASHIPLFGGVAAAAASLNQNTRCMTRLFLCLFLVIHAGLHFGFSRDPNYEFHSLLSGFLIYGGAAIGGVYIFLDRIGRLLAPPPNRDNVTSKVSRV